MPTTMISRLNLSTDILNLKKAKFCRIAQPKTSQSTKLWALLSVTRCD